MYNILCICSTEAETIVWTAFGIESDLC